MVVLYSTLRCEDSEDRFGIFVTTGYGHYSIYRSDSSDCEWLIPGTWRE